MALIPAVVIRAGLGGALAWELQASQFAQSGLAPLDMTTVSAVQFNIQRPDGTTTSLVATILVATPTALLAQANYQSTDLGQIGTYMADAELTVTGDPNHVIARPPQPFRGVSEFSR